MKEFLMLETSENEVKHMGKVEEQLNDGWNIVASGQYVNGEFYITYYTHMVKETEELEKK